MKWGAKWDAERMPFRYAAAVALMSEAVVLQHAPEGFAGALIGMGYGLINGYCVGIMVGRVMRESTRSFYDRLHRELDALHAEHMAQLRTLARKQRRDDGEEWKR